METNPFLIFLLIFLFLLAVFFFAWALYLLIHRKKVTTGYYILTYDNTALTPNGALTQGNISGGTGSTGSTGSTGGICPQNLSNPILTPTTSGNCAFITSIINPGSAIQLWNFIPISSGSTNYYIQNVASKQYLTYPTGTQSPINLTSTTTTATTFALTNSISSTSASGLNYIYDANNNQYSLNLNASASIPYAIQMYPQGSPPSASNPITNYTSNTLWLIVPSNIVT